MPTTLLYFNEATDLDLQDRIESMLLRSQYQALRYLAVRAKNGTVTVSGRVSTFHERQLAISLCQHVPGVIEVVDQVVVEPPA